METQINSRFRDKNTENTVMNCKGGGGGGGAGGWGGGCLLY